jgi:hypothetical protein
MKIAIQGGQLLIIDASPSQYAIIKSWNKMRWVKAEQMLQGRADMDLLNKLAGIIKLPETIETERQRMLASAAAVDRERLNEDPQPLATFPVKVPLFKHQTRAVNMALLTFGVVAPREESNGSN